MNEAHAVRRATGGFIIDVVDREDGAITEEIVFTTIEATLDYLRDVLADRTGASTAVPGKDAN